jgi:superfamily I DNA and/or RNA helicase
MWLHYETQIGESYHEENPIEVEMVAFIVDKLVNKEKISPSDIGIISPYTNQLKKISVEIRRLGERIYNCLRIKTVDGFQGGERKFIILSLVRSGKCKQLSEHLRSPERVNVALTRARDGLIIIGDYVTFYVDPLWKRLIDEYYEAGAIKLW